MRFLVTTLILFVTLVPQVYPFSINVDPPSIYTKAKQGETYSGKITVENKSQEAITVKVYAQDWVYQESSLDKKFLELGQTPYSLKQVLTLYINELTIPAKEKRDVLYDIKSPNQKEGGLYGVIFFETEPVLASPTASVWLVGNIGSIIYHEIEGSQKYKFDIVFDKLEKTSDGTSLTFKLVNQSNVHIDLKGSLLLLSPHKDVIDRLDIQNAKALPNETRSFVLFTKKDISLLKGSGLLTLSYANKLYSQEILIGNTSEEEDEE